MNYAGTSRLSWQRARLAPLTGVRRAAAGAAAATGADQTLRPGARVPWRTGALLVLLAAVVRIAYILIFLRHYELQADADHYNRIATSVARGQGWSAEFPYPFAHPTAFRPPLYPMLLGAMYFLFGEHIVVAQMLNVALGCGVVLLTAIVATPARWAPGRAHRRGHRGGVPAVDRERHRASYRTARPAAPAAG